MNRNFFSPSELSNQGFVDSVTNNIHRFFQDGALTLEQSQKLLKRLSDDGDSTEKLALGGAPTNQRYEKITKNDYDPEATVDITPTGVRTLELKDRDGRPIKIQQQAAPSFLRANEKFKADHNRDIIINSSLRSYGAQSDLYDSLKGKQAVAKPGFSKHEKGYSIDTADYQLAKPYLEKEGFIWKNYKNDPWHYDYQP